MRGLVLPFVRVILPNIDWHLYIYTSPYVLTFCTDTGARLGCNLLRRTPWVTVRLACQQVYITRHFWTFIYLALLLFLRFLFSSIGVVDCYRSLHPFFRVPHLKCKIRSDHQAGNMGEPTLLPSHIANGMTLQNQPASGFELAT